MLGGGYTFNIMAVRNFPDLVTNDSKRERRPVPDWLEIQIGLSLGRSRPLNDGWSTV